MKRNFKYLLLIAILVIIGINRVNASQYNGKLYEVWDTESGVNVYAAESNGYMDYNSWMIKSTIDNKIYYCIDPATPLEGSSSGSHNLYTDKEEIINKTDLTEAKYKKVQLLSYYGYGYKDENIDHTNKKWYGITQIMIWRIMRPDLSWTFKSSRNASPNNNLYASEVAELNKLVNDYSVLPSFAGKNITVKSGNSITIEDTNKVFNKYTVTNVSNNVKVTQNGNKLTLYCEYSTPYQVTSEIIPKTNEKFGALVSSDFQDIIRMGAPEKQTFKFTLEVTGGFVNIQKNDIETKEAKAQGDALLEGAVYEIYDKDGNAIKKVTTDESGIAKTGLDYGDYTIKEIKAPKGYIINNEEVKFTLSGKDNYITVNVYDKVIKGKIKLLKTKGGAGEKFTLEQGATFDIIDKSGKVVEQLETNENGLAIEKLPYGKYIIHQTKGEKGYIFAKDYIVEITEDKIYEIDLKNLKPSMLDFTKTDYSMDIPVPNALMQIYKDDDTLIYEGKTDKKGKIHLPNLSIGKYYILEKEAPKYYRLNHERMYFEVTDNGQIIKSIMKDQRQEGSLKIIKKDSKTNKPLKGVAFDIYFAETNKIMFKAKTDDNGEINIKTLIAGKYCIKETKTVIGYKLSNNKRCFEIDKEGQNVTVVVKNDKNLIKVPKTKAFNVIGILASIFILSGSSYFIYEKFN